MLVAEITKDIFYDKWNDEGGEYGSTNNVGRKFDYDAMLDWWGWHDLPLETDWLPKERTKFQLYDDDGELYYAGWLLNDDQGIVQQFVLSWGQSDSGCTTIYVHVSEGKYEQQIG